MTNAVPIKRLAKVTLGKMVQSHQRDGEDLLAPYLRAAHVQPGGRVIDLDDQPMYFSQSELRDLSLRSGDVVVVEGGAGFGRSAVLRQDLTGWGFQNSIVRLRPLSGRAHGAYLDYCLQSSLLTGRTELETGVATIPHFTAEKVSALRVWAPPLAEQRSIAAYLDRETAEIDALVAAQEGLIATLRERRIATIQATIARGATGVATKQGPEWIGDINETWKAASLAQVAAPRNVTVNDRDFPPLSVTKDGVVPQLDTVAKTDANDSRKLVLAGDFVINSRSDRKGSCGVSPFDGSVTPISIVLRLRPDLHGRFAHYVFRTHAFAEEFYRWGNGIVDDMWTTRWASMSRIRIPLPPMDEQRRIADYLDEKTAEIDALVEETERFIALSKERRAALITAAVTGQIDVGSVA